MLVSKLNFFPSDPPFHNYVFPAIFVSAVVATILFFDHFFSRLSKMKLFNNFLCFLSVRTSLRIILHINYGQ